MKCYIILYDDIYINNILHDVSWGWTFPLLSLDVCCCHTFGPTLQTSLRGTGLCSKLRRRRCWRRSFQLMKKVLHEKWIKVWSKCDILNHFDRRQLLPGAVNIKPSAPLSLEVGSSWDFTAYLDIWTESPLPTSSEWHLFWMWMMWCRSFRIGSFVLWLCLVSEHLVVSKTCQASPASGRRSWTAGDHAICTPPIGLLIPNSYIIPSP